MSIKEIYYYLFYKLYESFEASPSRWWSDWKASFSIDVLTYFLLLSFAVYYTLVTKINVFPDNALPVAITIVAIVAGFNYYVFNRNDRWRNYVKKFDKWPKRKNLIGGIIVWTFILLVFANLIFAFYLMSQIDWKLYR